DGTWDEAAPRSLPAVEQGTEFHAESSPPAANPVNPGRALVGRDVHRLVKQFTDLAPALGCHAVLPWSISLYSQASASLCSLPTVATEMPSARAVSSTVKPPKKRSSMIWHLRGSTASKPFKASP